MRYSLDSLLTGRRNQLKQCNTKAGIGRGPYSLGGIVRQTAPQKNKAHGPAPRVWEQELSDCLEGPALRMTQPQLASCLCHFASELGQEASGLAQIRCPSFGH